MILTSQPWTQKNKHFEYRWVPSPYCINYYALQKTQSFFFCNQSEFC